MRKLIAMTATVALATGLLAAAASARPAGGQPNIVELAQGSPDHETLVQLVIAADLADALSDPNANLTVFAPTDAAFERLERDVPGVTAALLDPANQELLQKVLLYHVLGKEVKAKAAIAAAKRGAKLSTLLGKGSAAKIELSLRGGKIRIDDSADIYRATVTAADLDASNGVVHVIDRVLIPKAVAKALDQAGLLDAR
jgi:uncharacterized surface protein with fasciclin (FAS1) repeats